MTVTLRLNIVTSTLYKSSDTEIVRKYNSIVPSKISIDLSFSLSCCMRPLLGYASLTLLIGRSYKHFSTGANDLVFATVKLMILPLYVLQLLINKW